MKKLISIGVMVGLIFCVYNIKPIYTYLDTNILNKQEFSREIIGDKDYIFDVENNFVEITDKLVVENRKDMLNVLYTSLNYGWDEVSFYCSESYNNCFSELKVIASENTYITSVDEMVHPFNKYKKVEIKQNNMGKITVFYNKLYTEEMIEYVDNKTDEIIKELNLGELDTETKVKKIHDYLINYANYSTEYEDDKTAYGFLLNKRGNCRGYTEIALILLHKAGIKTVPISNGHHVWNLVLGDEGWVHLDVTWDDPTSPDGKDYLIYDYFMISSSRLETLDVSGDHVYDTEFYNEENFLKIN